jgi:hypothetical protein
MRKFILIAAMVLASATAQASGTRSLTLASNDEPAAVEQPKASDKATDKATEAPQASEAAKPAETTAPTEAPKYVERPPGVDTSAQAAKADPTKPVAEKLATDKDSQSAKVAKPKRRHESTEARVIYELHRHGIYW